MLTTSLVRLPLLAAVLALAAPVQAQDAARAAITEFEYRLIDLDLSDGIAPSISFHTPSAWAHAMLHDPYAVESVYRFGAVERSSAEGGARAGVSSDGVFASSWRAPDASGRAWFDPEAGARIGFTLSPSTGLMLTAQGSLYVPGQANQTSSALLELELSMFGVGGSWGPTKVVEHRYYTNRGTREYDLRAYVETGSVAREGYYDLYAQTITHAAITPVPEPATWAMLVAGAAMMGFAARRQSGQQRSFHRPS